MDKNAIKKYAVWARRELISRVSGRAAWYGITEDSCVDTDADSIDGRVLSATEKSQRAAFISKMHHEGYEQAVEEVAYTWFNRFCALRYMEVNGYLPSHIRVFTNDTGEFKPQILDEAIHLEMDGLDRNKVLAYKDTNNTEELYRYLLITQCNDLNSILPGIFQKIEDYTELLLPENLLREGSVIERMILEIPEEDWTDQVQIIGWLYQYYNAEKKDEVFAALRHNIKITKENIPAATQLFTPDWIVHYMVENSLGRLWIEGHPNDKLKSSWKYYLDEAEQEPEVEEQLAEIRKEYTALKPEDIKCIDPCCGSGHILVYMFDVLMQIYKSFGYTTSDAVISIVTNNLYGLDIDERAVQLAYFAVMMKARSYDSRFFSRNIQPSVYAICESNDIDKSIVDYFVGDDLVLEKNFGILLDELFDAEEYGSILNISPINFDVLYARVENIKQEISFYGLTVQELILPLIRVAETLAIKYNVVVTNPPYMNASNMNVKLNNFIKQNYEEYKSDFFSAFIVHCTEMVNKNGFLGFFSPYVWMFIQSYEKLRNLIYSKLTIETLIQFEYSAFEEATVPVCTFALRGRRVEGEKGCYIRLTSFRGGMEIQRQKTLEAISNHDCGFYYEQSSDNYSKIPGLPVAYWADKNTILDFQNTTLGEHFFAGHGLLTGHDEGFVFYWFEVNYNKIGFSFNSVAEMQDSSKKFCPLAKGGEFRKWYGNLWFIIKYDKSSIKKMSKYPKFTPQNQNYYFKSGITWTEITSGNLGARYLPSGCIFSHKGPTVFSNITSELYSLLGFMTSSVSNYFVNLINPTITCSAGVMKKIPIVNLNNWNNTIPQECVKISRMDWNSFEISWDFQRHPLVRSCSSISSIFSTWESECYQRFIQIKKNEEELNRLFIDIYGLHGKLTPEVEEKNVTVRKANLQRDIKSLISYAVGCMFGRYSLDFDGLAYAGGNWDNSRYITYQPDNNGILPICDDEYFTDDIVGHFVDFIRTVYGEETLEENLQFIANALGGNGSSREIIRKYFLNDFFADHCKIYQKRPIYWLFDSGKKNGFKCLIYLHRYRPDTIARIRTDYVHEQQARYRTAIADLENRIETASTSDRIKLNKELKKVQEQADELHDYEEKIHHLADQYIDIDLDDGVKVNYAKFQDVLAKIK